MSKKIKLDNNFYKQTRKRFKKYNNNKSVSHARFSQLKQNNFKNLHQTDETNETFKHFDTFF